MHLDSPEAWNAGDRQRITELQADQHCHQWLKHKHEEGAGISNGRCRFPFEPTIKWVISTTRFRNEVDNFFRTSSRSRDFHGVISGATFTQEMYNECKEINRLYAAEGITCDVRVRRRSTSNSPEAEVREYEDKRSDNDRKIRRSRTPPAAFRRKWRPLSNKERSKERN